MWLPCSTSQSVSSFSVVPSHTCTRTHTQSQLTSFNFLPIHRSFPRVPEVNNSVSRATLRNCFQVIAFFPPTYFTYRYRNRFKTGDFPYPFPSSSSSFSVSILPHPLSFSSAPLPCLISRRSTLLIDASLT